MPTFTVPNNTKHQKEVRVMKHDFKALGEKVDSKNRHLSLALFYAVRLNREVIDFHDAMYDDDLEDTARFFDENGITEMTISSGWSGTLNAIAFFVNKGWKMVGTTEVLTGTNSYERGEDGKYIEIPDTCVALRFEKESK